MSPLSLIHIGSLFLIFLLLQDVLGEIRLEDNIYKDVVIGINPEVPEDHRLISAIKQSFTEASYDLFTATKQRAYFGKIKILIPSTWKNTEAKFTAQESYDQAKIVVAPTNPVHAHEPYTIQPGICGEPGSMIHLTPEYLTNDNFIYDFGPRGKIIVHEWAHLRWGVFDETPLESESTKSFYKDPDGQLQYSRCPKSLAGEIREIDYITKSVNECKLNETTGLPTSSKCRFLPYFEQPEGFMTSLMTVQFIPQITSFCHDDDSDPLNRHNPDVNNEHNRICNRRSVWDVIMTSPDFSDGRNSPVDRNDLSPTFEIVRPIPFRKVALVVDTSGSMEGRRVGQLRQMIDLFLQNIVLLQDRVSLVEFHSWAKRLESLSMLESVRDIEKFLSSIPIDAFGGTCLGCGLRKAVRSLANEDSEEQIGGDIVVFTDGQENVEPYVSNLFNTFIENGQYRLHVIFLSSKGNEDLFDLVERSGGTWFFGYDTDINSLVGAFSRILQNIDGDVSTLVSTVYQESHHIDDKEEMTDDIFVDDTIGNNTVFTFTWAESHLQPRIVLTDPDGCRYSVEWEAEETAECPYIRFYMDMDFKIIRFLPPGTSKKGKWNYSLLSSASQRYTMTVTSQPSSTDVIVVRSGMQASTRLFAPVMVAAQVTKNKIPITGLSLLADVIKPDGSKSQIELLDNGENPDRVANDGTYSRFFIDYDIVGRYSVVVKVFGDNPTSTSVMESPAAFWFGHFHSNGTVVINPAGSNRKDRLQKRGNSESETGKFSRILLGNGIRINHLRPSEKKKSSDSIRIPPPDKITDLRAQKNVRTKINDGILIRFTSPRAYATKSKVFKYRVCYTFEDSRDLIRNFKKSTNCIEEALHGNLLDPRPPGEGESFLIPTPSLESHPDALRIAFAVQAFDKYQNAGEPSNIAFITIDQVRARGVNIRSSDTPPVTRTNPFQQLFAARRRRIMCLTCNNARSEEECREQGQIVTCPYHQKSCGTITRRFRNEKPRIFKFCKETSVCHQELAQNKANEYQLRWGIVNSGECNKARKHSICRCCCEMQRCNVDEECREP